jgi:purine-binding chemotaxis protein CheW
MDNENDIIVFLIDNHQFAIGLSLVERVTTIVEICPLPKAPNHIAGTINYCGELLPVIDMRKLFLLPLREIKLTDQLIIVKTDKMRLAIWVDSAIEIVSLYNHQTITTDRFYLEDELIEGIFKLNNGRVLISDPDKFLTPEQTEKLTILLSKER